MTVGLKLAEDDLSEDVGGQPLLSVLLLEGLTPVGGRQFEDSGAGPQRQQAQEISEVRLGFDPVHLAAGDQRHEGRVDLGSLIVANEQPVLAFMRRSA